MIFDQAWFIKHQRKLLLLLRFKLFRWCLRIDTDKQIIEILPHCYTVRGEKENEYITDFRSHNKYAKRLYFAFKPFWYLLHFLDWLVIDRFIPQWSFGFSTLTTYPDANPETTTVDGAVYRSITTETFGTIRAGAGTAFDDTFSTDSYPRITASSTVNQFATLGRFICLFNTGILGSAATVSSVVLSIFGDTTLGKVTNLGDTTINIASASPASSTALAASDYGNVGTTSYASIAIAASFSTTAYNDFTLDANGIANISKTGISKFSAQLGWDINNSFTGSWVASDTTKVGICAADFAGISQDPKLVVTYTNAKILPINRLRPRIFSPGLAR